MDDDFGAVINCAIRYCIGRRTYMPSLVTSWIMKNCSGKLTNKTLWCAKRDIDEAINLGDPQDIETWRNFRNWLEKQGANNT